MGKNDKIVANIYKRERNMSEEEIIEIISKFVKEKCENETSGHDWWHIKRVYNNAMLINKEEKANNFIVSMIALLHDVYDYKFFDGNIEEKLEETLKELGVYNYMKEDDVKNITYSCANLSFSSNMKETKELSIEGKIAQDADRLDATGAMGISRTFIYNGKKGNQLYDPDDTTETNPEEYRLRGSRTAINHFYDKLLHIKEKINTDTAKKIAEKRHKFVEEFLNEFLQEWNGKK